MANGINMPILFIATRRQVVVCVVSQIFNDGDVAAAAATAAADIANDDDDDDEPVAMTTVCKYSPLLLSVFLFIAHSLTQPASS